MNWVLASTLSAAIILTTTGRALGWTVAVREVVSTATIVSSRGNPAAPLEPGTQLDSPQLIRTSPDARIHMEIGKSVVRLGADSEIQLAQAGLVLGHGSLVYADVGRELALTINLAGAEVRIEGETGFVHAAPDSGEEPLVLVGALSGKTVVRVGGGIVRLASGQLVGITPEGAGPIVPFDLSSQLRTGALLTGFATPLPTLKRVQAAERTFRRLERRGFISRDLVRAGQTPLPLDLSSEPQARLASAVPAGSGTAAELMMAGDGVLGFQSSLNIFAPASCDSSSHKLTIKRCTPPPPPSSSEPGGKYGKKTGKD